MKENAFLSKELWHEIEQWDRYLPTVGEEMVSCA